MNNELPRPKIDPLPPRTPDAFEQMLHRANARRWRRTSSVLGCALLAAGAIAVGMTGNGDEAVTTGADPSNSTSTTAATSTSTSSAATTSVDTSSPATTAPTGEPSRTLPTTSAPTTTERAVDPDEAAAITFIDAWRRGDAETMRQVGAADQVDVALGYGTAEGEPDCTTQPNGQYQCVVSVSSGTHMYLLVGEPGDQAGRVWYVAEYAPGEGGGP